MVKKLILFNKKNLINLFLLLHTIHITMTSPSFEQVSTYMMEKYNIHFVDWDQNRGGSPVNHKHLIAKSSYMDFSNKSLEEIGSFLAFLITSSYWTDFRSEETCYNKHYGKSGHFAGPWNDKEKLGMIFIMGNID